jgi:hypothetical protein
MAETVSWNYVQNGKTGKLVILWKDTVEGHTFSQQSTRSYYGSITRIVTDPDDTIVPTANYDMTLLDEDGVDVALNLLQNRHATNIESVYPTQAGSTADTFTGVTVAGRLTLTSAPSESRVEGKGASGKVTIYFGRGPMD